MTSVSFDTNIRDFDRTLKFVPPKEMLEELVRTVPFSERTSISLVKEGITPPDWRIMKNSQKFVTICVGAKIIPETVYVKFDFNGKLTTMHSYLPGICQEVLDNYSDTLFKMKVRGNPSYDFNFELNNSKEFSIFREKLLEPLLAENYHIFSGEIWSSIYHKPQYHNDYTEEMGGGVRFNLDGGKNSSGLNLKFTTDDKKNLKLANWFDALKTKYQPKK